MLHIAFLLRIDFRECFSKILRTLGLGSTLYLSLSVYVCLCLCICLFVSLHLGHCHQHQMLSFQKIYGLYGLDSRTSYSGDKWLKVGRRCHHGDNQTGSENRASHQLIDTGLLTFAMNSILMISKWIILLNNVVWFAIVHW